MADRGLPSSQFPQVQGLAATDFAIVLSTVAGAVNNAIITWQNVFSNTAADHVVLPGHNLIVAPGPTPANSSANTIPGRIWSDGSYIYFAISNNSIGRAQLTTAF
jgi:hypothetical protein